MKNTNKLIDGFAKATGIIALFLLVGVLSAKAQSSTSSVTVEGHTYTGTCVDATQHCEIRETSSPFGAGWDNDRAMWVGYKPFIKVCKARGIKVNRFAKLDSSNACFVAFQNSTKGGK